MTHELHGLLADTRTALLAGDLAALSAMAERTEAAIATLPASRAELVELQAGAARNAALLAAGLRGVRAARRRLAEIAGYGRFSTYDAQGRLGLVGGAPAKPMRRA